MPDVIAAALKNLLGAGATQAQIDAAYTAILGRIAQTTATTGTRMAVADIAGVLATSAGQGAAQGVATVISNAGAGGLASLTTTPGIWTPVAQTLPAAVEAAAAANAAAAAELRAARAALSMGKRNNKGFIWTGVIVIFGVVIVVTGITIGIISKVTGIGQPSATPTTIVGIPGGLTPQELEDCKRGIPPAPRLGGAQPVCPSPIAGNATPPGGAATTTARAATTTTTPESCDTRLANAVKAAIPSFPFYGQSDAAKQEITSPLRSSYQISNADGASSANVGTPRSVVFGSNWSVSSCRTNRSPQDLTAAFQALRDPCGAPSTRIVVQNGVFGSNSCLGTSANAGATDINFSGDPYEGSGTAFIVTSCADISVRAGVAVYAPPSHGARNKPDAIQAMRADGEKYAREVSTKLVAAANAACAQNPR